MINDKARDIMVDITTSIQNKSITYNFYKVYNSLKIKK